MNAGHFGIPLLICHLLEFFDADFLIALASICLTTVGQFCLKVGMSGAAATAVRAELLASKEELDFTKIPFDLPLCGPSSVARLSVPLRRDVTKAPPIGLNRPRSQFSTWLISLKTDLAAAQRRLAVNHRHLDHGPNLKTI